MIRRKRNTMLLTRRATSLWSRMLLVAALTLGMLEVAKTAEPVKFPENHIELMKYWGSPKDLDLANKELNALLALLLPDADLHNQYIQSDIPKQISQEFRNQIKAWLDETSNTIRTQKRRKALVHLIEEIKTLYQGYEYLQNEEFGLALNIFLNLPSRLEQWEKAAPEGPYISVSTLEDFVDDGLEDSKKRNYYQDIHVEFWSDRSNYTVHGTQKTLRAYSGPKSAISILQSFWQDWKSNRLGGFELEMLIAETYYQLGDYRRAQQIYDHLIQNMVFRKGIYNPILKKWTPATEAEKKLIRIRSAFNQIAWGDQYFKRARGLPDCDKDEQLKLAFNKYWFAKEDLGELCSAPTESDKPTGGGSWGSSRPGPPDKATKPVPLLERFTDIPDHKFERVQDQDKQKAGQIGQDLLIEGWSDRTSLEQIGKLLSQDYTVFATPDFRYPIFATICAQPDQNPLIVEACARTEMQLFKLRENLNYLGYPDNLVPDQRYRFLYARASEYADLTINAENRYVQFKKEAENLEYMNRQLGQNAQLAIYQEQIANTRRKMTSDKVDQAEWRIKAIDEKISAIQSSSFWRSIAGAFKTMGAGFSLGSIGQAGAAVFGMYANSIASSGEISALYKQRQAEQLNKQIAIKERHVADLEIIIAQMQATFLRDNLNFLASKEMNQELHYQLANTLKRIKRGYLDAGIRMGFLTERALAFETGRPNLQFIKFDYELSALKGLLAGDFLKQDLVMMENDRVLALKQRNHIKHVISLREHYPIEFTRFLETGRMDFATGLYEFDKAYPGTYQRRVRRVEVAIQGLVGPEGFKGSLTNFGSFAVRSKDKTMSVNSLSDGLDTYSLPPTRLVLSRYDIRRDQLIFPPEAEVREVFDGFGPSGLWRLELPKNLNDVDYRAIADVQLILYLDAFYDPELEAKVGGYYDVTTNRWQRGLIEKYEGKQSGQKLDRIAMFSLRQHFPDEFFSFTGGKVEIELLDADFPLYAKDKKIKKVIVRALGKKGTGAQGIGMTITHTGSKTLTINALTGPDGFTTDPAQATDLPPGDQLPIVGTWTIELRDPAQAQDVDDLMIFIEYEYNEK